jgi:hypothetical protein
MAKYSVIYMVDHLYEDGSNSEDPHQKMSGEFEANNYQHLVEVVREHVEENGDTFHHIIYHSVITAEA